MTSNIKKALRTFTALSVVWLACPPSSIAADDNGGPAGIMPAQAAAAPEYDISEGEETHPMIRLTPDKPQIVHLDSDARSIIVGNPAHLNAIMDSVRSIVLIPRDPGATHLTVIGQNGKPIMERYVIVASPADKYIRIRRNCNGAGLNSNNCAPTSIFFCPDMCYETKVMGSALGQLTNTPGPLGIPGSTGGMQQAPPPEPAAIENSNTKPAGEH